MAEHKHDFERDGLCIICDADFWQVAHEEIARLRSGLHAAMSAIDMMMTAQQPFQDQWFTERDQLLQHARCALNTPDHTVVGS